MIGSKLLFAVSLLLLALAPVGALSADVKAQSSTQYLWYNDPFQDKTQGDLLQYVKLSATKIDAANRFSAVGYGRVSRQFGSSGETDRGDSDDVLGRLYFLYMNYAIHEDRGDVDVHYLPAAAVLYGPPTITSSSPAINRNWKGGVRAQEGTRKGQH